MSSFPNTRVSCINKDNTPHQIFGRDISALLNPRPLALIGACGADGEACFATVAWITPVSHDPAMIAFALRARSRTMNLLRNSGVCSVSTLSASEDGIALARLCGNCTGNKEDKGALVKHELIAVVPDVAVPVATHALSWLTCEVEKIENAGDHLLVIANVNEAYSRGDTDKQGHFATTDTLLCVQHDTFAQGDIFSPDAPINSDCR